MSDISKNQWQDDAHREKMSSYSKERWENPDYKEMLRETHKEKWQDPAYREKQLKARENLKKHIKDMKEFLTDVKNGVKFKELARKNDLGTTTLNRKIKEKFGPNGPKNYTELKEHLKGKSVEDVLKDIDERSGATQESRSEQSHEDKQGEIGETPHQEGDKDEKQPEEKSTDQKDRISEESTEQIPEKESEGIKEQVKETSEKLGKGKEFGMKLKPVREKDTHRQKPKETRAKEGGSKTPILTSGIRQKQPVQRGFKDYYGIDRGPSKRWKDYLGIDRIRNASGDDIKDLGGGKNDKGRDYDGIDKPRERKGKDYVKLEDNYGEGRYEG